MLIKLEQVIGLPVETQSGQNLGKVIDINLDIKNHAVNAYIVKHGFLNSSNLFVKPAQVIEISDKKVVVDDGIVNNYDGGEIAYKAPKIFADISQFSKK